jgi:tRNA(fMet)-specific endonuclease VapC
MAYLLDSDIVIDFLGDDADTVALINTLTASGIFVSIISFMETFQGVIDNGLTQDDQNMFNQFFASVPVIALSPAIAIRCAHIRSALKGQGRSIRRRALDLLIAATALEHGLELVTHNEDDYKDIPNVMRYQW